MTTKVHAVTDGLGNPLRFLLSSGNRNDICMAQALLEPFDLSGRLILADKGYDSDKFVHWIGDYPKFCVTAKSGANRVKFIMGGRRVIDCRLVYNITPVGRDVKTKSFISPLPSI